MPFLEFVVPVVVIALVALVAAVCFLFFRRGKDDAGQRASGNLSDARKGAKVLRTVKNYARLHQYKVIAPAKLAKDGKCADLDLILVGWFGLLCVKCVGFGGEIYGTKNDETWLQVNAGKRVSFKNPLRAAEAETRLVRDILFSDGLRSIAVETVCVFTNKKATLALPRSTGHYTVKEFRALLRKDKYEQDKRVDIDAVCAAIEKWRVESL